MTFVPRILFSHPVDRAYVNQAFDALEEFLDPSLPRIHPWDEPYEHEGVQGRVWTIPEGKEELLWSQIDKSKYTQLPDGRWWKPLRSQKPKD